jgi:hypothetical protein
LAVKSDLPRQDILLPRWNAPPQFVEEVKQEHHMDIPLISGQRLQLREYRKALTFSAKS